MRRPSPALVISLIALFVALGGAGWAATGGTFILGKSNSADATSYLTAPVDGSALNVSNTSTTSGATALRLNVAAGHAPLSVNSTARVPSLDADLLDSHDSTYFMRNGASAGGDLSGTYPSPSIKNGAVGPAKLGVMPAVRGTTPQGYFPDSQGCFPVAFSILGANEVPIPFTQEDFDTASMHQTVVLDGSDCPTNYADISKFVAPRDGIYQISAGAIWVDSLSTPDGTRQIILKKDGSTYLAADQASASPQNENTIENVSTLARLNAGDYVQAFAWHSVSNQDRSIGYAADGRNFFAMNWVGP
jgi:hypothetical protein